jgi:hypothetical protein
MDLVTLAEGIEHHTLQVVRTDHVACERFEIGKRALERRPFLVAVDDARWHEPAVAGRCGCDLDVDTVMLHGGDADRSDGEHPHGRRIDAGVRDGILWLIGAGVAKGRSVIPLSVA